MWGCLDSWIPGRGWAVCLAGPLGADEGGAGALAPLKEQCCPVQLAVGTAVSFHGISLTGKLKLVRQRYSPAWYNYLTAPMCVHTFAVDNNEAVLSKMVFLKRNKKGILSKFKVMARYATQLLCPLANAPPKGRPAPRSRESRQEWLGCQLLMRIGIQNPPPTWEGDDSTARGGGHKVSSYSIDVWPLGSSFSSKFK